ncbi:MAG: hypothetical protein ACO1OB_32415 [Archangium sp.]
MVERAIYEADPDGWLSPHLQKHPGEEPRIPVLNKNERAMSATALPDAWRWVLATIAEAVAKLP